jgi:flagellin-like protein
MKANRKFKESEEAVSAVIGVILMVAITVAIAATVYVYVSGLATAPTSEAENASVVVKNENGKIKITLATAGNNMPDTGYSMASAVTIRNNGTALTETNAGTYLEIGGALFLGNSTVDLVNNAAWLSTLGAGSYSITVVIGETVVYDDVIRVT